MPETPHEMVDSALDGAVSTVRGAGEQVASTLDSPLQQVGLPSPGPHRVIDRVLSGAIRGVQDVGDGIIGGLNVVKEALGGMRGGFGGIGRRGGGLRPPRFR